MGSNRPDTLYSALVRPRRLDRKVEFGLPDLEGRTRILKIHAKVRLCYVWSLHYDMYNITVITFLKKNGVCIL